MKRDRKPLRPDDAPHLGTVYRDWRDFTDRVARPWIENDGNDARADAWYHALMIERDPWYLACALVFADNRIRELEAAGVPDTPPPSDLVEAARTAAEVLRAQVKQYHHPVGPYAASEAVFAILNRLDAGVPDTEKTEDQ